MKNVEIQYLSAKEMAVLGVIKDAWMNQVKASYIALILDGKMCRTEVNRTLKSLIEKDIVVKQGRHVHTRYTLRSKT